VATAVAGRTDAGVHARGQVVSFGTDQDLDTARLLVALNRMLPDSIVVLSCAQAADDFDARFSATSRSYRYRVLATTLRDPFIRRYSWHVPEPLDTAGMRHAAAFFAGEHDFASFCRKAEGRSTIRTVLESDWTAGGAVLEYRVTATSFCHQMVRSMVALMVEVGRGRVDVAEVPGILEARDRAAAKGAAPPHGLFLWSVGYD
jgi:tRNA pseudouridine38-40 synthase